MALALSATAAVFFAIQSAADFVHLSSFAFLRVEGEGLRVRGCEGEGLQGRGVARINPETFGLVEGS